MDKIILGILMLKRLTSYEIRNIIRLNYKPMCSDSLGTIQATLKKMLEIGLVTYNEFVERSVNKKVYSITDAGREVYMSWLKTPFDMGKSKNMEIGKLLLMGLVPETERGALIDGSISMLENELSGLLEIQRNIGMDAEKERFLSELEKDREYALGIKTATGNPDMTKNADAIGAFQEITLQFGIDSTKFQIEWLEKLRAKISSKETGV